MSAYGTFSLLRDPQGSCQHRGRCPHPFATPRQGCRKTSCTLTTERCRLQPVRPVATRLLQALTGFQLRPLRLVLLPPRRWRGVKGDEVVNFTLDALNRPNTHRRGRWIGFATCPAASQVRGGLGQSPKGLFFVFEVVRVDVTVQKVKKMCIFRIFATKNTANLAF